jgi:hypothetical protein
MEHVTSSAALGGFTETFHFSTDALPEHDRLAVWHEVLHSRFVQLDCELLTDNASVHNAGVRFPVTSTVCVRRGVAPAGNCVGATMKPRIVALGGRQQSRSFLGSSPWEPKVRRT